MDPGRGRQRSDLTVSADVPPASPFKAAPRSRLPLGTALVWHLVSLAVGAIVLMYFNRGQWFFGDEWGFLVDRAITIGDKGLFAPHNEHWSTGPLLIYGALFRAFGMASYAPYVAVLIALHLAVVHLMWRVMLRGGVVPWVATVFCAAFIPFGPGAENLLWAFQIGFVGSVAFGLGYTLLVDHGGRLDRRDHIGWGVGVAGLTFSSITVPLVGMAAVAAWLRRGFPAFLAAVAVPAAAYLVWFLSVGGLSVQEDPPISTESLRLLPQFIMRAFSEILRWGTSTPLVGLLAMAVTVGALVSRVRRGRPLPVAALAGLVGAILVTFVVAVVRSPHGLQIAEATRYVYIGGALLLPLSVIGLSDFLGRRLVGVLLLGALAVPWGVHNALLLQEAAHAEADRERLIHEQIVAAAQLVERSLVLRRLPEPVFSPNLHLAELELLEPQISEGIVPSPHAMIRAALSLQVSWTTTPEFTPPAAPEETRAFDATTAISPDGCLHAEPTGPKARLVLPLGEPFSLDVTSDVTRDLELLASAQGIEPEYVILFHMPEGVTRYLNVAIDETVTGEGSLIVRVPVRTTFCPVEAR